MDVGIHIHVLCMCVYEFVDVVLYWAKVYACVCVFIDQRLMLSLSSYFSLH